MLAESDALPRLFTHARRPDWGLAVIAEDRAVRRSYLFQDGRLRTFSKRFLHMFKRAQAPTDVTRQLARRLNRQVPRRLETPTMRREAKATFAQQCQVFRDAFPGGFNDPAYVRWFRRGPRPRKSHAQVGFQTARRLLSKRRMRAHLEGDHPTDVHRDAVRLIEATAICTARNKKVLKGLSPERQRIFSEGLFDVLHGEDPFLHRFTRLLASIDGLEKQPSWTAMTLFAGLREPEEHVIVHTRSFDLQARAMMPELVFSKLPSPGQYVRLLDLARTVEARLGEAGFEPRDLVDVHHFIRQTLRPKALQAMKTLPNAA